MEHLTNKDFTSDQEVKWCPGCGDYAILRAMQKNTDGYTPMYDKKKTIQENLQGLHDHLGYWPIPLKHKYVYEDIKIKYDKDLGSLDGPESIKHTWDEEIPF